MSALPLCYGEWPTRPTRSRREKGYSPSQIMGTVTFFIRALNRAPGSNSACRSGRGKQIDEVKSATYVSSEDDCCRKSRCEVCLRKESPHPSLIFVPSPSCDPQGFIRCYRQASRGLLA